MTSGPEVGESGTDPELGGQGSGRGAVTKPGSSIVLYVIAGVPILIVFVLAVVFRSIPVLMVLVLGGILGGTVGAVRSRIRNQQASPSTRAQSTAAGATVGLLAAVGLTGVGFVVFAVGLVVILMMALQSWR